ncbi:hypothetical protein DPSP01_008404 [Paraphaeosphaeria sporulosa]
MFGAPYSNLFLRPYLQQRVEVLEVYDFGYGFLWQRLYGSYEGATSETWCDEKSFVKEVFASILVLRTRLSFYLGPHFNTKHLTFKMPFWVVRLRRRLGEALGCKREVSS